MFNLVSVVDTGALIFSETVMGKRENLGFLSDKSDAGKFCEWLAALEADTFPNSTDGFTYWFRVIDTGVWAEIQAVGLPCLDDLFHEFCA